MTAKSSKTDAVIRWLLLLGVVVAGVVVVVVVVTNASSEFSLIQSR